MEVHADRKWLEWMIQSLSEISEPCEAGVQRQSYSPEYRRAVDFVRRQMELAGLTTWEDPVGNLFGRVPGEASELPEFLSGSHLDTVRCAGAYDGIAGVICALEAARMVVASGKPLRHPYTVFGTIGEEGTRFGQVLLGSQFIAGKFGEKELDRLHGVEDGKSLRQAMREYGLSGDLAGVDQHEKTVCGVLELHGEQGPILEAEKKDIGIVKTIAGIWWLEVEVSGQSNHSGTVPMNLRRDAGITAYRMILALNDFVTKKYSGLATITAGQLKLSPGSANCIPGICRFTLDIRSSDRDILRAIVAQVNKVAASLQTSGMGIQIHVVSSREPTPLDSGLQMAIEESCREKGVSYRQIDSGAGHDSMIFADFWPTAMIFLPNRDGISHNPAEHISGQSLQLGAELLYHTIRKMDK